VRIGITYGEILLDARGVRHGAVINKAFRLEGLSRDAFVQIEGQGETSAIPQRDRVFLGEDAAEAARACGFSLAPVGIFTLKASPDFTACTGRFREALGGAKMALREDGVEE
jgi:class 3 adenylate cyclase